MNCIYNAVINIANRAICHAGKSCNRRQSATGGKAERFVKGQLRAMEAVMRSATRRPDNVVWVHASSYGEYNVARPILKELRLTHRYYILMTFFSPTGYDAVSAMDSSVSYIDETLYLPLDTPANARRFVDTVRPVKAVFIISEIWPNYLDVLYNRGIPSYLVSAKTSSRTAALKWYGGIFRHALRKFTTIMTLDTTSERALRRVGVNNVVTTGDPLFDNALAVARMPYSNPVIERFCSGRDVFVAGSISDCKDLDLVTFLANNNRGQKCIFVPHEISEENLMRIRAGIAGRCLLYSECSDDTDLDNVQVLIIDFLGALARIYRFCRYAYVGGGFTPYLHSVIEATVYGLPVAFGPNIYRKNTPRELIELGIGQMVTSGPQLDRWYRGLKADTARIEHIRRTTVSYAQSNAGSTRQIIDIITKV